MTFDRDRTSISDAQDAGGPHKARSLMARYQRGDAAAVGELVTILSPLLLRFFETAAEGREPAEKLLEQCWRRIHEVRRSWRPGAPVLPWIFAVARQVRADDERGRWLRRLWSAARRRPAPLAGTPARQFRRRRSELDQLLAELPAKQSEAVFMLLIARLDVAEIAGVTKSTVAAARRHADGGLARLRRRLAADCFGGEACPFFGALRPRPIQPAREFASTPHSRLFNERIRTRSN